MLHVIQHIQSPITLLKVVFDSCLGQPLNPIKNSWSWMDYQLTKKQIASHEMLKKELTKSWLEIPIKMIENLIESMLRRLQACLKNNGGHIPY